MRHVTLDALQKVGDEIMTPLELDIDLGKTILVFLPGNNKPIVGADHPQDKNHCNPGGDK